MHGDFQITLYTIHTNPMLAVCLLTKISINYRSKLNRFSSLFPEDRETVTFAKYISAQLLREFRSLTVYLKCYNNNNNNDNNNTESHSNVCASV